MIRLKMKKKMGKGWLKGVGFLVLIFSLVFNLFFYQKIQRFREKEQILVKDVFDGDTFYLENQLKVRLLNVDAPDLEYCAGQDSKKRLEELILGKKVRIDWVTTDQYGRALALVYQNKNFINLIMVEEGWGNYEGRKIDQSEELVAATRKAKEEGRGIFSPDCYQRENPNKPECRIKGNNSRDTGKKIYHFPGCNNYSQIIVEKFGGDDWFCSEKEAEKAGFKKSENCFGKIYTPETQN